VFLLTACNKTQIYSLNSDREVGNVIDGKYVAFSDPSHEIVGNLLLNDGRYEFASGKNIDDATNDQISEFFFIQIPNGTYKIEYFGKIGPGTKLKELDDGEILLTISFDTEETINKDNISSRYKSFFIRYDKESSSLYFHSLFSELSFWRIEKQLN